MQRYQTNAFNFRKCSLLIYSLLCAAWATIGFSQQTTVPSGVSFRLTDTEQIGLSSEAIADFINQKDEAHADLPAVITASMLQQTPMLEPRITVGEQNRNPIVDVARLSLTSGSGANVRSTGVRSSYFGTRDRVAGAEALPQASADLADLLRKSPSALSVGVQSKTPVIHDPRVRGSRVGSLAASGSHWVPARADLDTMLSKFDSRQVESTTITPGPYTSLLGPGFAFTDVQLLSSPRYRKGPEAHGGTDLEYRANGNQFFGQQSVLLGASNWGSRFNYSNRSGDDYVDGNNNRVPSSYRSQEMTLAVGRDWENDSLEVNVLRLDQTNLVFPGYVFDIDFLVTDGYEVTHARKGDGVFDRIQTDVWYNRTRFEGNAQNPRKRPFFPVFNEIAYEGFTDVDSMSTGYRQAFVYGGSDIDSVKFSIGHDLRFVKQELNEISNSATLTFPQFFLTNRNSPIPKSYIANPGLFVEYEEEVTDRTIVRLGGRVDYAASDITDNPGKLAAVGLDFNPTTYAEVVGTDRYDRDFNLLSGFMSLKQSLSEEGTGTMSLGYAERAPTLTELYAAQPFMLLLQNGLNNVTGDPTLKQEKLLQFDLGYEYREDRMNAGIRGYHAWAFDYITFENTQTTYFPPNADTRQVSLRYVNTDLATLTGTEAFTELFPKSPFTPFANLRFVDGIDRTRNGHFATTNGSQGNASQKDPTQVRGAASGVTGSSSEALPNIPPLDTRVGIRFHDTSPKMRWSVELSNRIVNAQKRVATSLLESTTAGFSTWDLRSVFRPAINDRLVIASGVENIFDRQYREHFDFRTPSGLSVFQPGTNFYLSSSLTY
jgi:iron complex outermembrane recepter protein